MRVTNRTTHGTSYKTFRRANYSTSSKPKNFMAGGYFTDWGVCSAYSKAHLPNNNINSNQIASGAIRGKGDTSNWYDDESATWEE